VINLNEATDVMSFIDLARKKNRNSSEEERMTMIDKAPS
jgi:hypothetical protein